MCVYISHLAIIDGKRLLFTTPLSCKGNKISYRSILINCDDQQHKPLANFELALSYLRHVEHFPRKRLEKVDSNPESLTKFFGYNQHT